MYDYECELDATRPNCLRDYNHNDCQKAIFEAIDLQFTRINLSQDHFDRIDTLPEEIKEKYHFVRIQKIDGKLFYQNHGVSDWHINTRFKQVLNKIKDKKISDLDIVAILYDENHHTTEEYDEIFYSGPVWTVAYNHQDMTSAGENNMVLFPDGWVCDTEHDIRDTYKSKVQFFQKKNDSLSLNNKKDLAVFRGSANINLWQNELSINGINDHPRLKIPFLGALFPDYLDTKTGGIPLKQEGKPHNNATKLGTMLDDLYKGKKVNYLSYKDQASYKYVISLDGNGAAWTRPLYTSFSSSLLIYQTDYVQWFQPALQPNVHYLPLQRDLSNLLEGIKWARNHSSEVVEMIENANIVANKCFTPKAINQQLEYILKQYASKFTYKINNKNFNKTYL